MKPVLQFLAVGAIVSCLPVIFRARGAVRSTTLTTAAGWSALAILAWLMASLVGLGVSANSPGTSDFLWYGVSVVSLCPAVAVLGAKRPGSRAWNYFVLLPLLLVLGMPAIQSWNSSDNPQLHIETPWLIGHGLVIVMGIGNYLGTRFTGAALLLATALVLLLASFRFGLKADGFRVMAAISISAAVWTARSAARRTLHPAGFDRVWNDFRDHFGIVWARRIQDRLNDTAKKEAWPCRLELHGFHWDEPVDPAARQKAEGQIEHALRWILRRFVDPEWIDRRLGKESGVG